MSKLRVSSIKYGLLFLVVPLAGILYLNDRYVGSRVRAQAAEYGKPDIRVSARFDYYVNPLVCVYDLQPVGPAASDADVWLFFLGVSERLIDRKYSRIDLRYCGDPRFQLDGDSYFKLGQSAKNWFAMPDNRLDLSLEKKLKMLSLKKEFLAAVKTSDGQPAFTLKISNDDAATLLFRSKSIEDAFIEFNDRWHRTPVLTGTTEPKK